MKPVSKLVITLACTGAMLTLASAPTLALTLQETLQSFSAIANAGEQTEFKADVSSGDCTLQVVVKVDKTDPTVTQSELKIDKSCSTGQMQLTGLFETSLGAAGCTIDYDDPAYVGPTVGCSTDVRDTPLLVQLFEDAVAAIQQTSPANPTATFLADALSEATCLIAGGGAAEYTTVLADYQAAVSGLNETVEDFERFANGSQVPDFIFQAVPGSVFLHAGAVTFESSPASIQVFPEDFPFVVLSGGGAGGDAGISSSAGGGRFNSFDTIQARFSSPVAAAGFFHNSPTFTLESVTSDGAERASPLLGTPGIPGPNNFVGILSTCRDNRIDLIRLIPGAVLGGFGTAGWGMNEMRFSTEP